MIGRLLACFCVLVLVGCSKSPEITRYKVPRLEEQSEQRMLAAIIPRGPQAWFFKLQGGADAVASQKATFRELIGSIQAESTAGIKWSLPSGWKQQPGNELRFATLVIPPAEGRPELEVSVTVLPVEGGRVSDAYLLQNLNRWRGQLQLASLGEDWNKEVEKVPFAGGEAILADWVGKPDPRARMMPPFAGGAGAMPPSSDENSDSAPATASNEPGDPALQFDAPQEWAPGRMSAMRKAAFEAKQGEKKVEITVIDLPAAVNPLAANIQRWRGLVGLPSIPDNELQLEKIPAGPHTGDLVTLVGKNKDDQPEALYGAMVVVGDTAWFIKMQGDPEVAAQEKDRFLAFIKSLKFAE